MLYKTHTHGENLNIMSVLLQGTETILTFQTSKSRVSVYPGPTCCEKLDWPIKKVGYICLMLYHVMADATAGCMSASCLGGQRWPTASEGPSCFYAQWSFPGAPPLNKRAKERETPISIDNLFHISRLQTLQWRDPPSCSVFEGVIITENSCCGV